MEDDGMYQKIDIDEILVFLQLSDEDVKYIYCRMYRQNIKNKKKNPGNRRRLKREYFCRIHKSFLVNPRYITEVKKSEIKMDNNEILSVSKARRKTFEDMFAEYLSYRK